MRVLHVIPSISPVHGGPSHAMTAMEKALAAVGVSVTTLTTDDDGPGRRFAAGQRPRAVPGVARVYARKWLDSYKIAPGMVPWLWRHVRDFDAVHIHALFSFSSVAAALIARRRGVPYVVRPLGTLSAYGMAARRPWLKRLSLAIFERRLLREAAAVHFTSDAERREAMALNMPFHGVVIPLGVGGRERGEPEPILDEYPALRGRTVLLFLSRLDPKKNIEGLLRAFDMLRRRYPNVILAIAGSGLAAYRASLETLVRSLEVGQDVVWVGQADGARKTGLLAAAHVFVLPSFSENFGIAAVEAMRAGLPCVLGRGTAIARDVENAGAGLAVEPEPEAICRALATLVNDAPLRRAMGDRGRRFAEAEYSLGSMALRLRDDYGRIARPHVPA